MSVRLFSLLLSMPDAGKIASVFVRDVLPYSVPSYRAPWRVRARFNPLALGRRSSLNFAMNLIFTMADFEKAAAR